MAAVVGCNQHPWACPSESHLILIPVIFLFSASSLQAPIQSLENTSKLKAEKEKKKKKA